MYLYTLPEQVYTDYQRYKYLVSLKGGGQVIATRDNGHWFGMWRWLKDEEVTGWMNLEDAIEQTTSEIIEIMCPEEKLGWLESLAKEYGVTARILDGVQIVPDEDNNFICMNSVKLSNVNDKFMKALQGE